MKTQRLLILSLLGFTFVTTLHAENSVPKTVSVSAFDTMKYSVSQIEVHPGQKVVVELKNEGTIAKEVMSHNWILLKPGANAAAYLNAAMMAKSEGYEPKSQADKVIASIPLVGSKESARVSFTAPSAPGSYTYFCSFPGHYAAGMKGLLIVK